jgi:phosphoglycerate dehydrogenase-like enzyme
LEARLMDLKACRLLVTATSYGKHDPALKALLGERVAEVVYNPTGKPLSSQQLQALLPGIDGYIAGLDEIDSQALAAADRLQVISRYGVGVDNVDLISARARGIIVTNTPGANTVSVAELALGLMLAVMRRIPAAVDATRRGEWPRLSGITLEGKTVGLLGFGAIGRELAVRLAGFNCRVLAHDPVPDAAFAAKHAVTLVTRDELLADADILSLHLPLLPETRGLVDADVLARLKPGAFLINTARGEILDEAAVLEALRSGRLAGAALDTFSEEPPSPTNPLLALAQVLVTPHMGAHADSAINAMGWLSTRDCLAVLAGEPPKYRVV